MDTAVTDQLLTTTRAVRKKLDLDREVEPEVITECLRLAVQAPTPGAAQSWRWLVVRDQELRNQLGAIFREVGSAYMARRREVAGAAAEEQPMKRILESGQYLVVRFLTALLGLIRGQVIALAVIEESAVDVGLFQPGRDGKVLHRVARGHLSHHVGPDGQGYARRVAAAHHFTR